MTYYNLADGVIEEDLDKEELVTISSSLQPSTVGQLSALLHKTQAVYDDIVQCYPHSPSCDMALRVLERWFDSVSSSSTNRQILVSAVEKTGQHRLACSIARKMY